MHNVNIADCMVARRHIHIDEYKWSGQLTEIGTCLEIQIELVWIYHMIESV